MQTFQIKTLIQFLKFDIFYMFRAVLRMNPWGPKHAADVKSWIKALIWKVCISLVHAA